MQHRPNRFSRPLRTYAITLLLAAGHLLVPAPPATATAVTFEGRMVELINEARAAIGVAPVQLSAGLASVAGDRPYQGCGFPIAGRSADMGARNYFSHALLNCGGHGLTDMLDAADVPHGEVAENIAWANALTDPLEAAEQLHHDLMASPPHRGTILNPAYTRVGVGSWHTAAGASWSGGGTALGNVYVATEVFTTLSVAETSPRSRYHPLTPSRILDTRTGGTQVGAGTTLDLQVAGSGGVPATGVSAVVLNVAVTAPTAFSYLTVFPSGELMPLAANLNFGPGQTLSNLVTAKLGAGGGLGVYNAAGTVQIVADVAGWYDDATLGYGGRYHPVTPARILDTRTSSGPLGGATTMGLQVTGQGGVPASGVSAVVMNMAVTAPTAPSYLTIFPTGEEMPVASNLNYGPGDTVANLVTAKVGAGGGLCLYNAAGTTQVIADVAGWYDDGTATTGAGFHPVTPSRILDTRDRGELIGATALDLQVAGSGGVPSTGVSAVVMNLAVTGATEASYLTVFPTGEGKPPTSNLNFVPGQTVPNLVVVKLGAGGRASITNAAGTTHVIADVAGWFDAD